VKWIAAVLLGGWIAQSAAPPRDPRTAPPAVTQASLTGRVVDDRGAPVPGVTVVAVGGPPLPGARPAITSEDGRYTIRDLAPGLYTVAASKAGYPTIVQGQTRVDRPGKVFEIKAGQEMVLTLTMPRGAVIAGVLVDENGEPAGGPAFVARSPGEAVAARPRWNSASTNSRGAFRVSGVAPGTYHVTTTAPNAPGYPEEVAAAMTVTVGPGDVREGIVLQIKSQQSQPTTYVTVAASAVDGQPMRSFQLTLRKAGQARPGYASNRPNPDGTRTITDVAAGQYRIVARNGPYWGAADVLVDGEHPASVSISLVPGVRLRGTVTFDGATPPRQRPSISLHPADADNIVEDGGFATAAADGTFVMNGVPPGRYVVYAINSDRDGWTLASAKLGETDITDIPLTVGGQDIDGVVVSLTTSRTVLTGIVSDPSGTGVNGVDVVAFPADEKYRVRSSRRVSVSRTTVAGEYEFRGLPPGVYGLAVVDEADREALRDPAVLGRLKAAVTVTLAPGETKQHAITLK
jgi:hypothetical protein